MATPTATIITHHLHDSFTAESVISDLLPLSPSTTEAAEMKLLGSFSKGQ
jgi:hypothetical protein